MQKDSSYKERSSPVEEPLKSRPRCARRLGWLINIQNWLHVERGLLALDVHARTPIDRRSGCEGENP